MKTKVELKLFDTKRNRMRKNNFYKANIR